MEYKEYKEYIQREFQYITKDNILFWNLWNISYPFDVLATYREAYPEEYTLFSEMYFSCWEMLYQVDEKREENKIRKVIGVQFILCKKSMK